MGISLVGVSSVLAPAKDGLADPPAGSGPVVPSQFEVLLGISLIVLSQVGGWGSSIGWNAEQVEASRRHLHL